MKKQLILVIILLLALVIRIYDLDKTPPALFGDEVDVGYQAYSILKTGKDINGNVFPVLIQSLAEYRAPLFIYSAVPFVGIFGLNEFGVRLTAVFWGILGIFGFYLLTKKLFQEKIAFIAAFVMTISPWHIHYSRAGFEVTMLLAAIVFATYFFIKGLQKKYFLLISAVFFGLTPYIYSTAVVFMPILILVLLIIYHKEIRKSLTYLLAGSAILIIVLSPYFYQTISGKAGERFSVVSIFTQKAFDDKNEILKRSGKENLTGIEKIFHNKPAIWAQIFTLNYFRAFSPEFLFLTGDPNFRHSVHEMGQMYYFEILLLLLGIYLVVSLRNKNSYLLLLWLLIAPIPAALTYDGGFHATRTFLMLVPLSILLAIGMDLIIRRIKFRRFQILAGILVILSIFNLSFYFHRYFNHYSAESWVFWHYGYKEVMQYIGSYEHDYDRILINNTYEPSLERFLFWTKYDPARFQNITNKEVSVNNVTDGFDGFSLNNRYFFGKANKPTQELLTDRDLYLASARDDITNPEILKDSRIKVLKTVNSPNGLPLFYLLSGVPKNQ